MEPVPNRMAGTLESLAEDRPPGPSNTLGCLEDNANQMLRYIRPTTSENVGQRRSLGGLSFRQEDDRSEL